MLKPRYPNIVVGDSNKFIGSCGRWDIWTDRTYKYVAVCAVSRLGAFSNYYLSHLYFYPTMQFINDRKFLLREHYASDEEWQEILNFVYLFGADNAEI